MRKFVIDVGDFGFLLDYLSTNLCHFETMNSIWLHSILITAEKKTKKKRINYIISQRLVRV